jgi:hypothetical protein
VTPGHQLQRRENKASLRRCTGKGMAGRKCPSSSASEETESRTYGRVVERAGWKRWKEAKKAKKQ